MVSYKESAMSAPRRYEEQNDIVHNYQQEIKIVPLSFLRIGPKPPTSSEHGPNFWIPALPDSFRFAT